MTVNRRTFATLCAATLVAPMFGCASSAPAAKTRSWETMDRATLDRAYNNSAAVPESGAMFKEWIGRSEELRAQHPEHLNLAYGPRPLGGGVAISGLFELEPLLGSYVNDKLRMDRAMAKRNSPILVLPKTSKQLDLFAGAAELPEMRRQTADYARARRDAGLPVRYAE